MDASFKDPAIIGVCPFSVTLFAQTNPLGSLDSHPAFRSEHQLRPDLLDVRQRSEPDGFQRQG